MGTSAYMAFVSLGYGGANIVMSGSEMGRLASLMTYPSLRQQLQSANHTSGNRVLLDWLTAAISTV